MHLPRGKIHTHWLQRGIMKRLSLNSDGRDGFVRCYEKYSRNIRIYLNRMVRDEFVSEELMQDSFMKVMEKGYDMDPESPGTLNLIVTVAKRKALDYLKRRRLESVKYQEIRFREALLDDRFYKDLEEYHIHCEIVSTLHDEIDAFSGNLREAIVDRVCEGVKRIVASRRRRVSLYRIMQAEMTLRKRLKAGLGAYFIES